VKVTIEQTTHTLSAIIDPGSTISFIKPSYVSRMKHIKEGAHTIDNKQSIKISKIDKTIKICLDDITTNIQIYSFEQMDFDLLLGINWCIATKATFDFSKNKINTTNGTVNTLESDIIKEKTFMDTILSSDSKLKKLCDQFFLKEVLLPNHREHDCKLQ
jgi:Retroviral aspartyl protease